MENRTISPEIKDHYEVVKVLPGEVKFGKNTYDLRTIDKATADELVKQNFPYLKPKKASAASGSGTGK